MEMNKIDTDTEIIINKMKNGKKFSSRSCSLCDYPIGFFLKKEQIYFESSCDCVSYYRASPFTLEELQEVLILNPNIDFTEEKYFI